MKFRLLVLHNRLPSCFRLFLVRQFHRMVHHDLALQGLADLYLVLVIDVFITSFDKHVYPK